MRLDVPYFKQDTDYTCGPTSLQMVLAYYGVRESEEGLAHELHTNDDVGTKHRRLIDAAAKRGFYSYVNEDAPLSEILHLIEQEIPPIVHWRELSENDGHYSVAIGFTDDSLILHDPWNGEALPIAHREFEGRWLCGPEGDCKRWLMALSREPFQVGRQYRPS